MLIRRKDLRGEVTSLGQEFAFLTDILVRPAEKFDHCALGSVAVVTCRISDGRMIPKEIDVFELNVVSFSRGVDGAHRDSHGPFGGRRDDLAARAVSRAAPRASDGGLGVFGFGEDGEENCLAFRRRIAVVDVAFEIGEILIGRTPSIVSALGSLPVVVRERGGSVDGVAGAVVERVRVAAGKRARSAASAVATSKESSSASDVANTTTASRRSDVGLVVAVVAARTTVVDI